MQSFSDGEVRYIFLFFLNFFGNLSPQKYGGCHFQHLFENACYQVFILNPLASIGLVAQKSIQIGRVKKYFVLDQ